jgi:D-threo-aldose 1-dehydrogenase
MDKVLLPSSGLAVSRLGFGCASLMANLDRAQSLQLLEVAFDNGITHFDVARSYGYGASESVLGDFIQHRRDKITVATKFGIAPPSKALSGSAVKSLVRSVVKQVPFLRPFFRRNAGRLISRGRFDVASAHQSLEVSLRELRTDYIDLLCMHECSVEEACRADLLDFLKTCVAQGKIRYYGVASFHNVVRQVSEVPRLERLVYQFPDSISNPAPPELFRIDDTITHSSIGKAHRVVSERLAEEPAMARTWRSCLDMDCTDTETLGALLLAWAMARNSSGAVLFSSQRSERISRNIQLAFDLFKDVERLRFFEGLANEALEPIRIAPRPEPGVS